MLKTQIYLRQFNDWEIALQSLLNNYGIRSTINEADGRVILNYCQIESNKQEEIAKECRGLILDRYDNWNIVARSFNRFFNVGEKETDVKNFNWENCTCQIKNDGSLLILSYYQGKWHCTTRGSFGKSNVNGTEITWKQLFKLSMGNNGLTYTDLNKEYTYIFELCSRYNKVVRDYPFPTLYLITIFEKERELSIQEVKSHCNSKFNLTEEKRFNNIDDVIQFVKSNSLNDPTFEGFVLRDINNLRIKVKSPKYVELHKLHNNGNLSSPKSLIKIILDGEIDEVKSYFPELSTKIKDMEIIINEEYIRLENVWMKSKNFDNQKDFAEYVLRETKFSGILFSARKTGTSVNGVWRNSSDIIFKKLFQNR